MKPRKQTQKPASLGSRNRSRYIRAYWKSIRPSSLWSIEVVGRSGMAAAIRSMPGKLGNRRSVADLVWHFEVRTLNNNNHELNLGYFSRRPLDYLSVENRPCNVRCPKKVEPKDQVIPYKLLGASLISRSSRYCPRIVIDAHFALEEFNKEKNAQMQYVRIVNAYTQWGGGWTYHFLTMDTIAPNNVIQMYQAIVKYHITGTPPELLLFGLVSDNGNGGLLKLMDRRQRGHSGPIDNRHVGTVFFKVQREERYPLEDEMRIKQLVHPQIVLVRC